MIGNREVKGLKYIIYTDTLESDVKKRIEKSLRVKLYAFAEVEKMVLSPSSLHFT